MTALNDERREQVRKMREAGMSYKAIGAALDPPCSKQNIMVMIARMDAREKIDSARKRSTIKNT